MSALVHDCIFCDLKFCRIEYLAAHLVEQHSGDVITIGKRGRQFCVRINYGYQEVLCLCYGTFVRDENVPRTDWAPFVPVVVNSFTRHLKQVGGMAAHLQALRDEALLDKIEHSCREPHVRQ